MTDIMQFESPEEVRDYLRSEFSRTDGSAIERMQNIHGLLHSLKTESTGIDFEEVVGPLVTEWCNDNHGDYVVPPLDVFAPRQFHDHGLVQGWDGREVEGAQALDGGEAGGADPALHHALVAVHEFQFRQPQQVPWMVHPPRQRTGRPSSRTP